MNLKRQLLLVSLLTLMLPWAGCEFVRETESALRALQEEMLLGTAQATAGNLAQYVEEFPSPDNDAPENDRLYMHDLSIEPTIDGYFDDWPLERVSMRSLHGADGPISIVAGIAGDHAFFYVEVRDRNLIYTVNQSTAAEDDPGFADRVMLLSQTPPYLDETFHFSAEAPGPIISYKWVDENLETAPAVRAHWQDMAGGYQLEARIPVNKLGSNLGVVVRNTADPTNPGVRVASFQGSTPGPAGRTLTELSDVIVDLVHPGMRMVVTDAQGWRVATIDKLGEEMAAPVSAWGRRVYDLLVERGDDATLADPDPHGRETQPYVLSALGGDDAGSWYHGSERGLAVVAVASPVVADGEVIGAVILQQSTDAILSLTNARLAQLVNLTLIATLLVAGALLGYATWLSRRIRRLSVAAEQAVESERLHDALPSAGSGDEVGDLARSFSLVLRQLGDYNAYLKTLASKLSHELRTPLAIVTSSLENLEHESLDSTSNEYVARARDGADRLRRILSAMSEASRVEELMENAEPESFDLRSVLDSTIAAYRDVYPERQFVFECTLESADANGSPELLIQMLDKLVDNAVGFSGEGDTIHVGLETTDGNLRISVMNPGPPLPERMQRQMFDSMVSMRDDKNSRHLGLGLYIARLIAEGHGGNIEASNVAGGVEFAVSIPAAE